MLYISICLITMYTLVSVTEPNNMVATGSVDCVLEIMLIVQVDVH